MPPNTKEYQHDYYLKNRAHLLARHSEYNAAHMDESKTYRLEHREEARAKAKVAQLDDPEKFRRRKKLDYQRHKPQRQAESRAYYHANPVERMAATRCWALAHNEHLKTYRMLRYHQDPSKQNRAGRAWEARFMEQYGMSYSTYFQTYGGIKYVHDMQESLNNVSEVTERSF